MTAFLFYILQVIVCSALFAGCYWCVLRNGRFYHWNRFYILSSVALSIIIPLLNIPLSPLYMVTPAATGYVAYFAMAPTEVAAVSLQSEASPVTWTWMGVILCLSIVFFLLAKEVISFVRILRLKRNSERICLPETVLYCTDDEAAPFTFFRSIFWKKGISLDSDEGHSILRHELAHVRLRHSWDKALMQLVCCLYWMNPFFMLFRRELELVHEFAADSESNAEELSSMLLCTLYPNNYRDFTSRFFQSSINRRIFMISQNKNKKSLMNMLRKMSIIPVALVAMYLFACEGGTQSQSQIDPWNPNDLEEVIQVVAFGKTGSKITQDEVEKVIRDSERKISRGVISQNKVQQKPVFQGVENGFREFINRKIVYPPVAIENGIEGVVVVSYVIDKDGNVTDVKSLEKIGLLSDEVERIIKSSPAWKPGSLNGKNAAVQCYSFVVFKLGTSTKTEVASDEEEFQFTKMAKEDRPLFNGKDAEAAFREWVYSKVIYPVAAMENGISGRVYVEFSIEKDGSVTNAKLLRSVDPLLDNETLRVIRLSPKWTPGKKDGKPVSVKYQYQLVFRLNN